MRTVVVGVDSEQQPKQVLLRDSAEAQAIGWPLQVLTAWTTPTCAGGTVGLDDLEAVRTGRAATQELAAGLLAEALHTRVEGRPVSASASGSFGDARDLLVRAGEDAGLVVVGARSHGPLLSAFLGSTASRVVHHASCPVMVGSRGVATGPYRRRVLVGFDESAGAGSAQRHDPGRAPRHPQHMSGTSQDRSGEGTPARRRRTAPDRPDPRASSVIAPQASGVRADSADQLRLLVAVPLHVRCLLERDRRVEVHR